MLKKIAKRLYGRSDNNTKNRFVALKRAQKRKELALSNSKFGIMASTGRNEVELRDDMPPCDDYSEYSQNFGSSKSLASEANYDHGYIQQNSSSSKSFNSAPIYEHNYTYNSGSSKSTNSVLTNYEPYKTVSSKSYNSVKTNSEPKASMYPYNFGSTKSINSVITNSEPESYNAYNPSVSSPYNCSGSSKSFNSAAQLESQSFGCTYNSDINSPINYESEPNYPYNTVSSKSYNSVMTNYEPKANIYPYSFGSSKSINSVITNSEPESHSSNIYACKSLSLSSSVPLQHIPNTYHSTSNKSFNSTSTNYDYDEHMNTYPPPPLSPFHYDSSKSFHSTESMEYDSTSLCQQPITKKMFNSPTIPESNNNSSSNNCSNSNSNSSSDQMNLPWFHPLFKASSFDALDDVFTLLTSSTEF